MAKLGFGVYEAVVIRLKEISYERLDVPLKVPFGIATGAQHVAKNVLIQLTLDDGTVGLGEAAPVSHISGESQEAVLSKLEDMAEVLSDYDLADYRRVCAAIGESLSEVPSGAAGVEIALFDALCRRWRLPLRSFFGGATSQITTDVTITTGTVQQGGAWAKRYTELGFSRLKIKVGADDLEADVRRLRSIVDAAPRAELVLDGNTVFSSDEALRLLEELGAAKDRVVLFEQPVARDDWEGLARVEARSGVPVAADESLRSRDDFLRILKTGGISVVNLKTAKLGLLGAWDLLVAAHAAGLEVMVGGMVETEISMTASACLAAGVGGVEFIDLDTPLFLGPRCVRGSVRPWGPVLDLYPVYSGHGAEIGMKEGRS